MSERDDAIQYLTEEGNLRVPCSRYGNDSESCAAVAYDATVAYLDATGEAMTNSLLDYIMGLVVNNHDDIAHLLGTDSEDEDNA